MIQALDYPGGTGLDGARMILLRAGVAALLNAADPNIAYDGILYDEPSEVIAAVQNALDSNSRSDMIALAAILDGLNNGVCNT
jgi:hypothetical protein